MNVVRKRDIQIPQITSTFSCAQRKEVKQTTKEHVQCIYFPTGNLHVDHASDHRSEENKNIKQILVGTSIGKGDRACLVEVTVFTVKKGNDFQDLVSEFLGRLNSGMTVLLQNFSPE